MEKITLSLSFDDGDVGYYLDQPFVYWDKGILDTLEEYRLKTMFFVCGSYLDNQVGKEILKNWSERGHFFGNHTFSHYDYNASINSNVFF